VLEGNYDNPKPKDEPKPDLEFYLPKEGA
jgi:hypothetical protein